MVKPSRAWRCWTAGSGTRSQSATSFNALRVRRVDQTSIQAFLILRRERKNLESRSTIFDVPSARNRRRRATKLPDDSTTKATAGGCRRCNNDALWVQPDNECNVDHRHRRATFARYDPRSECRNDRQRRPSYSGYHSCRSEGNGAVRFRR